MKQSYTVQHSSQFGIVYLGYPNLKLSLLQCISFYFNINIATFVGFQIAQKQRGFLSFVQGNRYCHRSVTVRHYTPHEERVTTFVDEFRISEFRSSNLTNRERARNSTTIWVPLSAVPTKNWLKTFDLIQIHFIWRAS